MVEYNQGFTPHTFRFPFSYVILGRTFSFTCEVNFATAEDDINGAQYDLDSLQAVNSDGILVDMSFLIDSDYEEYVKFLVHCISSNKSNWDTKRGKDGLEWWEGSRTDRGNVTN